MSRCVLVCAAACAVVPAGWAQGVVRWPNALNQPADWFSTAEAVRIADNLLVYQFDNGGWGKNVDMAAPLDEKKRAEIQASEAGGHTTIDNGATYTQLRYLARVFTATGELRFRDAFRRGFEFLLKAQYDNGGWPQFYPLRDGYWRHITYNDNAMIGVMELLRSVVRREPDFRFLPSADIARADTAIDKGLEIILRSQVRVNGRLTVWCAQHHAETLAPVKARSYEHPSLSGSESVGIVRYLMGIENPSPEVVTAIGSAIAWFNTAKVANTRIVVQTDASLPGGRDRRVVEDPSAPAIWARFYDIQTNQPIFSGRDGVIKRSLAEIEGERRNGYSWYGYYATGLLASDYPAWKAKRAGSK